MSALDRFYCILCYSSQAANVDFYFLVVQVMTACLGILTELMTVSEDNVKLLLDMQIVDLLTQLLHHTDCDVIIAANETITTTAVYEILRE